MHDHSLRILEREGIEAYSTVIGKPLNRSYDIAIRELTGVPFMQTLREDLIYDRDELLVAEQELEQGRVRQILHFSVVVAGLIACLAVVGYTLNTTHKFVERDLPRLVK